MHALPDAHTQSVLDALLEVHEVLGPHHPLEVYGQAMGIEFVRRGIPFQREAPLQVWYRGERLGVAQPVPFLCFGDVLVTPKSDPLSRYDETCLVNVVRGTRSRTALLASFAGERLHVRRVRNQGLVASVDTLAPDPPQPSSDDDPLLPL